MKKATLIVVLLVTIACMMVCAGCAGKGTLSSEISDETGAYTVKAADAGKDSAVGMTGGIVIGEDQVLSLDSNLSKGSLQFRVIDNAGEAVINEKLTGRVQTTFGLDPGDYGIGVVCNENGTTGTLVVSVIDASEVAK